MAKIAVHDLEGKKVGEMNLSDAVFAAPSNDDLLKQVYVAIAANNRNPIAHTKGKGEVSGSGKKPFRQKGTGNARQGQKRNPVMKGGGVSFGPTNERNFKHKVNRKMRQKALSVALSEKIRKGMVVLVDSLTASQIKTKAYAQAFSKLGVASRDSVLVGFSQQEKTSLLGVRNINRASGVEAKDLNVFDILNHKYLVLSKSSAAEIEAKYAQEK
ncbi:MAG TPA: 50S ribosomal protein L4 [Candidatus Moranbacteria bacterium]|nr:50S ribosomal protein L4 [Candidatus Moranbacteria bacterium]